MITVMITDAFFNLASVVLKNVFIKYAIKRIQMIVQDTLKISKKPITLHKEQCILYEKSQNFILNVTLLRHKKPKRKSNFEDMYVMD